MKKQVLKTVKKVNALRKALRTAEGAPVPAKKLVVTVKKSERKK